MLLRSYQPLLLLSTLILMSACALHSPSIAGTAAATPTVDVALVSDEPSPPGGLGNVVESFSRHFGRPPTGSAVNQPSYTYGNWPANGLFVQLDDSFRRAREVRISFGQTVSLTDARTRAQTYLPGDARRIHDFLEPGTGDQGTLYLSQRLRAVFPQLPPPGQFVVIYDGADDQIAGLILRMGAESQ